MLPYEEVLIRSYEVSNQLFRLSLCYHRITLKNIEVLTRIDICSLSIELRHIFFCNSIINMKDADLVLLEQFLNVFLSVKWVEWEECLEALPCTQKNFLRTTWVLWYEIRDIIDPVFIRYPNASFLCLMCINICPPICWQLLLPMAFALVFSSQVR